MNIENEREIILAALRDFANKRPGIEPGNYGDWAGYRAESRSVTSDLHHVHELLRVIDWWDSITADDLKHALTDAFSGRLSWNGEKLNYCVGQYFPTEYRKAVCAVLASALWSHWRKDIPSDVENQGEYLRKKARKEVSRGVYIRYFN